MATMYIISGAGWLSVKIEGKLVPVCKLTERQLRDLRMTLKELNIE